MLLAIGMVLAGVALVIGPWVGLFGDPGLLSQWILTGVGAVVLLVSGMLIIIARLYQKTSANEAFVRTGMGGRQVVLDGGAIVIPVVHKTVPVVLETMKLEVERGGEDALITRDNLRCDIRAEFYIKVQGVKDDILNASRSLGDRSVHADTVRELVFEKLVSALRSVAATRELAQLHAERDDFATAVSELVREDLKSNGLTLESVTISRLDQTNTDRLNEQNVFDAQGLRKIAEITQQARVERNAYERDAQRNITQKDVDTRKEVLDLEKEQAEAEATQQAEVAMIQSQQRQEAESYEIQQRQIVETKDIDKDRRVQEAGVQRDLAINVAKVNAEKDLIAKQQEQQTADILRNQAIQTADVERDRAVEIAKRERQVAIAEAEQRRAAAESEQLTAEAQREQAEQEVFTVEKVATADREKQVQVIAAQQNAEQEKIREQMEADIEAYKNAKVAEGEQQAATRLAEAIRTKAEAERDASRLAAEGEEAKQMVPVNVNREQVAVDAQRVQDVDAAQVEVLRSELAAKAEYEQISVELEKVLADISARKDVGVAFAESVGGALGHANMNLYGDPQMLGTALDSFAKAAGVSAWADGLASTLPKGTIEAAAATLSGAFPKISGVIDSVMAERKEAGGDGEKGERPSDRPEQEQAEKVAGAEMAEAPADEAPEPDVGSGEMPDIPGAPEPGSET